MNFKKLFPVKQKIVYLNSASTGPISKPAFEKMKEACRISMCTGKLDFFRDLLPVLEELRRNLSEFFGCKKHEIGFIKNTSQGILLSLLSIPFNKNSNIIVQKDSFPAIKIPALYSGHKVIFCDFSKDPVKNLKNKINKNTKAVLIDWVHFYKGYVLNLKEISDFCKEKGIFLIVDGIQGGGVIPINLNELKIDFFITQAAKWLCGPRGIGFIYVNSETIKKLNRNYIGWISLNWKNFEDFSKLPDLRKGAQVFEEGTYSEILVFGFNENIKILKKYGIKNIYKKVKNLVNILRKALMELNFEILPERVNETISGIISFKAPDSVGLFKKLTHKKIIISLRNNYIRVSPHFFNDKEEIKYFINNLKTGIK